MSWLEVNWTQPRPATPDLAWRDVQIRARTDALPPEVEAYLAELRRNNIHGDAVCAFFDLVGSNDFDWFASRNRWDELGFAQGFFSHAAVQQALPELTYKLRFEEGVAFQSSNPLTLDGELAKSLLWGGAYEKFRGTASEAKELGSQFCASVFGDRFLEIEVFACWNAWSEWFHDIAWDCTFLIVDRRNQSVVVLASTDTD